MCEPVEPPRDTTAYLHFFCAAESGDAHQLRDNEPKRVALYKLAAAFLRAYANLANEMQEAGYSDGGGSGDQGRGGPLRKGAPRGQACQRRLY